MSKIYDISICISSQKIVDINTFVVFDGRKYDSHSGVHWIEASTYRAFDVAVDNIEALEKQRKDYRWLKISSVTSLSGTAKECSSEKLPNLNIEYLTFLRYVIKRCNPSGEMINDEKINAMFEGLKFQLQLTKIQ